MAYFEGSVEGKGNVVTRTGTEISGLTLVAQSSMASVSIRLFRRGYYDWCEIKAVCSKTQKPTDILYCGPICRLTDYALPYADECNNFQYTSPKLAGVIEEGVI